MQALGYCTYILFKSQTSDVIFHFSKFRRFFFRRNLWIRFGYDPRKDRSASKYQSLDYRVRVEGGITHKVYKVWSLCVINKLLFYYPDVPAFSCSRLQSSSGRWNHSQGSLCVIYKLLFISLQAKRVAR